MPYITKRQIVRLRRIMKDANLEGASFGTIHETIEQNGREYTVDEFVKRKIELYMKTWIENPLITLVDALEKR